jgi:hypothetical protein
MKKLFVPALVLLFSAFGSVAQSTWQRQYFKSVDSTAVFNDVLSLSSGYISFGNLVDATNSSQSDLLLMRFGNDGAPIWSRTYSIQNEETGWRVKNFPTGGYILLASSVDTGFGNEVFHVLRTDTAGAILWSYSITSIDQLTVGDVEVLPDGNTILSGGLSPCDTNLSCGIALALDSNGVELWTKAYSHPLFGSLGAISLTSDNHLIHGGNSFDFSFNAYPWAVKTDLDGNLIWSNIYTGNPFNEIWDVIEAGASQSYVFTGQTSLSVNTPASGLILVTDTAGAVFGAGSVNNGISTVFYQAHYLPSSGNSLVTGATVTDTLSAIPLVKGAIAEISTATSSIVSSSTLSDNVNSSLIRRSVIDVQGDLILAINEETLQPANPYSALKKVPQIPGIACYNDVVTASGGLEVFSDNFGGAEGSISIGTTQASITSQFENISSSVICTFASLSEADSKSLQLYPNPASSLLFLELPFNTTSLAEIRDLRGAVVKTLQLRSGERTIDVSHLDAGLYLLKITTGHNDYITRFVKTN